MNRPSRGRLTALARWNLLLTTLLAALLLVGLGLPSVRNATAAVDTRVYCYSWEFLNNTAQDADGLHVLLEGVHSISAVYAGPDNPFGPPLPSSGYDAALDAYRLDFGGLALAGATTHIGVCADQPVLRLEAPGGQPSFYWTAGGQALQPDPLFLGMSWSWLPGGALHIELYNDSPAPLVLWSLNLLAAGQPLPLDDLGAGALATLPAVVELAPDVMTLPSFSTLTVTIPAAVLGPLSRGGALLLHADFAAEDDLGNAAAFYAQLLLPPDLYLPVIMR